MDLDIINNLLPFISGAFGVGVGWSTIRLKLNILDGRITKIETKQAILRGDNGNDPLFISPKECTTMRHACGLHMDKTSLELAEKALVNAKRIKRLENYARWTLQDKGLSLDKIDDILDPE